MSNACATISANPAVAYVGSAHAHFMQLGTATYNIAIENIAAMADIVMQPIQFNANFDFGMDLPEFNAPAAPVIDTTGLAFLPPPALAEPPEAPDVGVSFESAPDNLPSAPTLTFGPRPTTPNIPVPQSPSLPATPTIPTAPTFVLPDVPSFESFNLPTLATVTIPDFTSTAPTFIEPPFNQDWSFTQESYTHLLKHDLVAKLRPMIEGQEALPPAIEAGIFERSRSRIEVEVHREIEQAYSEFSARGLFEPSGLLNGRIMDIRQGGQNRIAEASRDVAIEQYKESLANLRFAITQGVALEGVWIQLHVEEQRFALQAATFMRESAIAVLTARVSVFNARMQAYAIEADVYRTRLQAELAKIEIFRAEIEAEIAKGQVNEQRVRLFNAQLDGIKTRAEIYRQQVEAVRVEADINRLGIERFKTEVDAYEGRWRAHEAEWRGYAASVEGEGRRADLYKSLVDGFSARVNAWATTQNVKVEMGRLKIAGHDAQLRAWSAGGDYYSKQLDAERTRIDAISRSIDARSRIYESSAQVASVHNDNQTRVFQAGLEAKRAEVDSQLKAADQAIAQMLGLVQQVVAIKTAMGQVSSNLAASAFSAVSYGASVSAGRSDTNNCSTSFQYVGEAADA